MLEFERHPNLGFITSCPTNLGTGLRASVHVKIPLLAAREELMDYKEKYHVDLRSSAGETGTLKGSAVIDVSNARRLGFTEFELINDMYRGVNAMIEREKELEKAKWEHYLLSIFYSLIEYLYSSPFYNFIIWVFLNIFYSLFSCFDNCVLEIWYILTGNLYSTYQL